MSTGRDCGCGAAATSHVGVVGDVARWVCGKCAGEAMARGEVISIMHYATLTREEMREIWPELGLD